MGVGSEVVIGDDIGDQQPPAGAQQAAKLGQAALGVRPMVGAVARDDHIKGPISKGQRLYIALAELDIVQPALLCAAPPLCQHLFGQVNAHHLRHVRRKGQRRVSRPAAGVEHLLAARQPSQQDQLLEVFAGGVHAAGAVIVGHGAELLRHCLFDAACARHEIVLQQ